MRCYVEPERWSTELIALSEEESHHLAHVLRVEVGQPATVFDGAGREASTTIAGIQRGCVTVRVLQQTLKPKPPVAITLIQSLPREQKMDLILQKATELEAFEILPAVSDNGVVRLRAGEDDGKRPRWEKIILNAAKQCGTAWMPTLKPVQSLMDVLPKLPRFDLLITCSLEPDARTLRDVIAEARAANPKTIGVLVGPEGDFSARELAAARQSGGRPASLGRSVLRVETATLYMLSILRYEFIDRPAR